jgi:hypothetical protein
MDQTITQADLTALAAKLDEFADVLSPKERSLLLAVFTLAGQTISARVHASSSPGGNQTESAGAAAPAQIALSMGFKDAFQEVGLADFNLSTNPARAAGSVGIGGIWLAAGRARPAATALSPAIFPSLLHVGCAGS